MVASSQVIVIKMVDAEVILVGNYLSFFSGFTLLFLGFVTVILYFFFSVLVQCNWHLFTLMVD